MNVADCLFCKMASGEIVVDKVFENDAVFVINDIHPLAQLHQLIILKNHYANFMDKSITSDAALNDLSAVVKALPALVELNNLQDKGFRLIQNNGQGIGQSVMHIHFHFMYDPKFKEQL